MTDTPGDANEAPSPVQDSTAPTRRRWPFWLGVIVLALIFWNAVVTVPVAQALSDEDGSTTVVYRRWLISPNQIVFDVWSVGGSQSMIEMDRRLLKAAEALQHRSFDQVALAYQGSTKFLMDGPYFQEIGASRQWQNPIYTIRTMQERLSNPDGSPAFESWSGGWLGVVAKQMEDHNEFHKRWWVRNALGLPPDASLAPAPMP